MGEFQTVGIIGKQGDARVAATLSVLCPLLMQLQRKVIVDTQIGDLVADTRLEFMPRAEMARACNLVIAVGGDGTLLGAARDVAPAGVPILGINQGRLGFMVDVRPAEMRETLAAIFGGQYLREERLLLSARILRDTNPAGPFLAVNDVVIRNQAAIRMLEFETWLEGEYISQHRADGFIVSSPTGSTAYALSSGGPVLHPALEAISLVPICPHTLSDRPIVVSSRQAVRIVLRGGEGTRAMFTCDGQTHHSINAGDAVEIGCASCRLTLVHPTNYSYFNILRNKLHWGRGPIQASEGH